MNNQSLIDAHVSDDDFFALLVESTRRETVTHGVTLPGFPEEVYQRNSIGSFGETALREGFGFYRQIKGFAPECGNPISADTRILDFGIGWGRIIRFFLKDVLVENIYGVDVDPYMIELCKDTNVPGTLCVINPLPPTKLPDASLDIIFAYSVFSHLSQDAADSWIEEFNRLLKPGGIVVATTQARNFIDYCEQLRNQQPEFEWHEKLRRSFVDTQAAFAAYDRGEFLFSPTGGGESRPSSFYGEALIPSAYMQKHWIKWFILKDFIVHSSYTVQNVFLLQKT